MCAGHLSHSPLWSLADFRFSDPLLSSSGWQVGSSFSPFSHCGVVDRTPAFPRVTHNHFLAHVATVVITFPRSWLPVFGSRGSAASEDEALGAGGVRG
ncbi:hypothetical protein L596_027220 [Steinernema carpocapsae]|uniref:Uncharacterized protein n=1 Tax=Steinernema carpocapsae TaxID=34508 RepID=A0A4U5M3N7_STECR|nr:hypothetical protein L596_027220 [Steinernema carpocapsae]